MVFALSLLVLVLLSGLGLVFWGLVQVANGIETAVNWIPELADAGRESSGTPGWYDDMHRRVKDLEEAVDLLPAKWAEFEESVARRENRVRTVVRRARERLAEAGYEDAGVEAEASQLQLLNDGGGADQPVQPVPQRVESPEQAPLPEGVEPWEVETWRRKYAGN